MATPPKKFPGIDSYVTKNGIRYRWWATHLDNPTQPGGKTTRTSKGGFLTEKEADTHRRRWLTNFENSGGTSKTFEGETFAAFSAKWMKLAAPNRSHGTMDGYEKILRNHLLPKFGHLQLNEITEEMLREHYAELRVNGRTDKRNLGGPLGANSLTKVHGLVKLLFDDAFEGGKIQINPSLRNKYLQIPTKIQIRAEKPETKTWTVEESYAFMAWNKNIWKDDLYLFWRIAILTGMRRSEIVALQWKDFSVENSTLFVQRAADPSRSRQIKKTKSFKNRMIELDPETVQELVSWKELRLSLGQQFVSNDAYIFSTYRNELRIPNDVSARWNRIVQKARRELGIELQTRVKLHELRHSHATQLQDMGVELDVLQRRLGHSVISTTVDIYAHGGKKMQSAAVDMLSKKLIQVAHDIAHGKSSAGE
jgi:integrase